MPADNKLWIPPLSPKDQERLSGGQEHRWQKVGKWLAKLPKWLIRWISFSDKTLWDILGIIAIPVVIAMVTMQFSAQQSETSARIAQDQQQESALQTYLDRMSDLLLSNKLRESQPGDEVRNIARARTLTVLPQLNGTRKGKIVHFLYETGLIARKSVIVSLESANLSGVDLIKANLIEANLSGADLDSANLTGANLFDTNLSDTDPDNINLGGPYPNDVCLGGIYIHDHCQNITDLSYANLSGAYLIDTELYGANLSHANLSSAIGVVPEQLDRAFSIKGAIMPDGSMHP